MIYQGVPEIAEGLTERGVQMTAQALKTRIRDGLWPSALLRVEEGGVRRRFVALSSDLDRIAEERRREIEELPTLGETNERRTR